MKARIKFVRKYKVYNFWMFDVIYESGRVVTYGDDDLPKTALDFINNASRKRIQWDRVFNREEGIYER